MFRTVIVVRDVAPWRRLVALAVSRGPTTVVVDDDANDEPNDGPNGVLDGARLLRTPRSPSDWAELLDGADGVVHAADGQGIDSLVAGLSHVPRRPRVLVFAEQLDRAARADDDRSVPSSASPAARTSIETIRRAGVRVSVARLGSCVDADTGIVPDLVPLYVARLGLRARGPSGFVAWCHGHDIARAIEFAIDSPVVGDAFDVVAPEPATLAELDEALAEALDRRPLVRISIASAGLVLGPAFTRALAVGRRVHPEVLVRADRRAAPALSPEMMARATRPEKRERRRPEDPYTRAPDRRPDHPRPRCRGRRARSRSVAPRAPSPRPSRRTSAASCAEEDSAG